VGSFTVELRHETDGPWRAGQERSLIATITHEYFDMTAFDLAHMTGNWVRRPVERAAVQARVVSRSLGKACCAGRTDACAACRGHRELAAELDRSARTTGEPAEGGRAYRFKLSVPRPGEYRLRLLAEGFKAEFAVELGGIPEAFLLDAGFVAEIPVIILE